ncbi:hypothetical protein GGS23DRAFT_390173 [Durotheca rogersii]|uniref:uncharacterized protein n=1 Tax=Durotheca rogersii TaxID=419775 RepID=UPI002220A40F|nr:uncharacterized protein GGS23DRAFT_390173 [Durotheca rogersii]KAI5856735.1 hypothetical protein GGS23DRAFT_390173 [Durotheca rogersii]
MAIDIPLKVKALFRPRLAKRRRPSDLASPPCQHSKKPRDEPAPTPDTAAGDRVSLDLQLSSPFFRDVPIEIRKMIYDLVWRDPYEDAYHSPRGRHIHFQEGRWSNTRCVMYDDDEDLDWIQKNMDRIPSSRAGDMVMWQKRLSSTWGSRHWRCEERIRHERQKSVDQTNFMSMMLVCKRMFPEVVESIFESYQFLFNDIYTAHRFFVYSPSPHVSHIRNLDLTLNLGFHEYAPFITDLPKSRVRELWEALGRISCLHNLRISLDIYDRGPWRKIPEQRVVAQLRDLRVLNNFTLELPPPLPIRVDPPNMHSLDAEEEAPFRVVRRPPLRYWQFMPGEVEHFRWETRTKGQQSHCFITPTREARHIPNPYLIDFF